MVSEMEKQKKFVAIQNDDGSVKLIPAEDLQVVRMLDSKMVPKGPDNAAANTFWVLLLLALLWFICGGWEMFLRR